MLLWPFLAQRGRDSSEAETSSVGSVKSEIEWDKLRRANELNKSIKV